MIVHQVRAPIFVNHLSDHEVIKPKILEVINAADKFSHSCSSGRITNTDFHVKDKFCAESSAQYWDLVLPSVNQHLSSLCSFFRTSGFIVDNYWFQEYHSGDQHTWHTHGACMFSNVYYLSLPDGACKTTFRIFGEEIEFDVSEGDIISFPSHIMHCSKEHKGEQPKIVIAFNSSLGG